MVKSYTFFSLIKGGKKRGGLGFHTASERRTKRHHHHLRSPPAKGPLKWALALSRSGATGQAQKGDQREGAPGHEEASPSLRRAWVSRAKPVRTKAEAAAAFRTTRGEAASGEGFGITEQAWPASFKRWREKERRSRKIPLGLGITSCAVGADQSSLQKDSQAGMLLITNQASVPSRSLRCAFQDGGLRNRCLETCGLLETRERNKGPRTQHAQKAAPHKDGALANRGRATARQEHGETEAEFQRWERCPRAEFQPAKPLCQGGTSLSVPGHPVAFAKDTHLRHAHQR